MSRYVRLEDKPHRYRLLETCPVRGVLVDAPGGEVWLPWAVVVREGEERLREQREQRGEVGE